MLLATGTVPLDNALWILTVFAVVLICVIIVMGVALNRSSEARKDLLDHQTALAKRREANVAVMRLINELRGIGSPVQHEAIPDERICVDLAWVFTISWESDDSALRVSLNHCVVTRAIVSHSVGGHDMPEYEYGPGRQSIDAVPACVRKILGIPEPEPVLEKSVGMSS